MSSISSVAWSTALLDLLHAPHTQANYLFLNQWATREHNGGPALSDGSNNPFFTTAGAGGAVAPFRAGMFPEWNSIGVARYPTLGIGVYANAVHISSQYPAIARAIRSGNPGAYANDAAFQHELTTWSGGGYAGFAAIQAPSAPVGPTVDPAKMLKDVSSAIGGKPPAPDPTPPAGTIGHWVPGKGFVPEPGQSIPNPNASVPGVSALLSTEHFLGRLTDPSYILRGLQIIAGAGLVATGTVLLARQIALAADLPDPLAAVASKGTSLAAPATAAVE